MKRRTSKILKHRFEEVDAEVKKVSDQFETPEKLKERLEQMGLSEEKMREDIKTKLQNSKAA